MFEHANSDTEMDSEDETATAVDERGSACHARVTSRSGGAGDAVGDRAEADVAAEVPDGFRIDDAAKASWAVRKIVEARAYGLRVREWAAREQRRAEREEHWLLLRFGAELEQWLRTELGRQGGRRRCVALPAGTVGLRRTPSRLEVADEAAVAEWCARSLPQAVRLIIDAEGEVALKLAAWLARNSGTVRVKRQVLREPLGRHLQTTGELPGGAAVRPATDVFYVK